MMNEIIKERLALIQSGTVPKGYKKTKCGIYPENWTLTCMGNCIREYREISNNIQDIPVYSSSRNGLLPQSEYYDGKEATQTNIGYKVVPPNYLTYRHMSDDDVFHFNMNQTGGNILVSSEYPVFTVSDIAELGFILPMLNNAPRFKYFCGMQKLGGTRSRLYFKKLCEYQFYIPPLAEQKKIAEILEQCDKIISLKQKCIDEEKRKKHGIVKRIFSSDAHKGWEEEPLGSICTFINGRAYKQDELLKVGKYPVLRVGNLFTKGEWYYSDLELAEDKYIDSGDLIYAWSASFGPQIWTGDKVIYHYHIWKVIPHARIDKNYLHQYFMYDVGLLAKEQQGGTMSHITKEAMEKRICRFPSLTQQKEIAQLLSMVDQKMELLQSELDEWEMKKKALMQLLLTGIVRVKP